MFLPHVIGMIFVMFSIGKAESRIDVVNLSQRFLNADAVVVATILESTTVVVNESECGTQYSANVTDVVKPSIHIKSTNIVFGRGSGLKEGKKYLLFLDYSNGIKQEYDRIKLKFGLPDELPEKKQDTFSLVKCNNLIPGLIYDEVTAWEVRLRYILIDGVRPDLPPTIRFNRDGALQWSLDKDQLFSYLKSLNAHNR